MNEIRKTICFDKYRSHYSGILPYIEFGDSGATSNFVVSNDTNGNWGQFPMDFALVCSCLCGETITYEASEIKKSGITESDKSVEARLRYCDLSRKYNFIQNQLRNGLYCKLIKQMSEETTIFDCEDNKYGCGENNNETETEIVPSLITKFDYLGIKYDYVPMKRTWFSQISEFVYRLLPIESIAEYETDETVEFILEKLSLDDAFIVLVDDYDTLVKYESDWVNWWVKWFGDEWYDLFPDHTVHPFFQFCIDFEKYCLGRICVPETYLSGNETKTISGILVPDYINYTDVEQLLLWFETNDSSAKTVSQQTVWDEHGGDNFYEYLKSVKTNWITEIPRYSGDGELECRLTYVSPYISIPVCLSHTFEYGDIYENYLVEGSYKPFSAVGIYSGYAQFNDSKYVVLEDSGTVESKLENVINQNAVEINGVIGVFKEFNEADDVSNIFKCTFYSGYSVSDGEVVTKTKYYTDGRFESVVTDDLSENESEPTTNGIPKRIWLVKKVQTKVDPNIDTYSPSDDTDIRNGVSAITETTAYTRYAYYWWECEQLSNQMAETMRCADGEYVEANENGKYRSIPLLSCIGGLVDNPSVGDIYYFLPSFDNGRVNDTNDACSVYGTSISSFSIPYENNTFFNMTKDEQTENVETFIGDYIGYDSIDIESGICTIRYVVGGKALYNDNTKTFNEVPNTGIHYLESHRIAQDVKSSIYIDNFMDVEFFYDKLDFENDKKLVYSDDYRMYRYANIAQLEGMEVGTMWTSGTAIIAKVFTNENTGMGFNGIVEKPNITMDRGNAAAFERYFKLSECNTLDDIRQYGNNFFNI